MNIFNQLTNLYMVIRVFRGPNTPICLTFLSPRANLVLWTGFETIYSQISWNTNTNVYYRDFPYISKIKQEVFF